MVARLVNDNTSDDHRSRLAELIPSVIGLTTTDRPPTPASRVLRDCGAADRISQAPERDGRVRARSRAGARCARRARARHTRPQKYRGARQRATRGSVGTAVRRQVPHFARGVPSLCRAPNIARMGVEAIAEASVSDNDERLYDLLAAVIGSARRSAADPGLPIAPAIPQPAASNR